MSETLTFRQMQESDIEAISPVMRRAFDDDAQKHLGQPTGGPPGYDDGEFFRTWLLPYDESIGYLVLKGEQIIGGIIVWILPEGHNILGTIFVDPDHQDHGVGQRTWGFIEQSYPETKSWRLATPEWATKNHAFYEKCGFQRVDDDPLIPPEENTAIYRKELGSLTQG
jgi:GNAT superfamily N-acetyltransferase